MMAWTRDARIDSITGGTRVYIYTCTDARQLYGAWCRERRAAYESYSSSVERMTTRQPRERAATMYGRLEAPGPPFAAAVAGVVDGASDPAVRDLVSADIFGRTRARGWGLISPLLLLPVQQCSYRHSIARFHDVQIQSSQYNVVFISYAYKYNTANIQYRKL